jgi:hypothetical protein
MPGIKAASTARRQRRESGCGAANHETSAMSEPESLPTTTQPAPAPRRGKLYGLIATVVAIITLFGLLLVTLLTDLLGS